MELRQYITLARRYLWLILLTTLLAGGTSYYYSRGMTPIYAATAVLQIDLANDPRNDIASSLYAGEMLSKTYVEFIRSPKVVGMALTALGLPAEPQDVAGMAGSVSASVVRDTQLIRITAMNADRLLAQNLANQVADAFIAQTAAKQQARYESGKRDLDRQIADLETRIKDTQKAMASLGNPADPRNANMPDYTRVELTQLQTDLSTNQTRYTILLSSAEEFRLAAARYSDNVTVFATADLPEGPVSPNKMRNTLLGLAVGLMLGAGIAFLREYLDDTLKSSADVTESLGLSTVGNIFRMAHLKKVADGLVTSLDHRSNVTEGYRTLRTNLQYAGLGGDGPSSARSLVVTSAGPGEGKSTTAANLAIVLAQAGKQVILVDADLRRPSLGHVFGLNGQAGLTALLQGTGPLAEVDLEPTDVENLRVLSAGTPPSNPAELLASARMTELLHELSAQADVVILDSPPVLAVTDASVLAAKADGAVLIVDVGATRRETGQRARETLEKAGAKILGAVLNKQRTGRDGGYYYYYYYYGDGHKNRRHGQK